MAAYVVTKDPTLLGVTNRDNSNLFVCDAASGPAAVTAAVAACGGFAAEWTATAVAAGVNVKGMITDVLDLS